MKDLIATVREYSNKIINDREPVDIFEALRDEVEELDAEMYGYSQGEDGIAGEAIDVINCALDLIFKANPEWTNDDIVAYAEKKCQKWLEKNSG